MDISKEFHGFMVDNLEVLLDGMTDKDEGFMVTGNGHDTAISDYLSEFIFMICREYVETHKGE